MNVLQLNDSALTGGAATLMNRLHRGLAAAGAASRILAAQVRGDGSTVGMLPPLSLTGRLCFHLLNMAGLNYAGIPGTAARIRTHPFFADADVLHLHNLHGGYFNYLALPALSRLKPVVWTLHDMWPLTGHCAHSFDCDRWQRGCGSCPYPKTYPPVRMDATRMDIKLKESAYRRTTAHVVCPSRWLFDCARRSVLGHLPIHHVPNGLDTDTFRPREQAACRKQLGLPQDARVILFAANIIDDQFKDFPLLLRALGGMGEKERERCLLLVVGAEPSTFRLDIDFPVQATGYVREERKMAEIYSAADVLAYPTRADNQPLVVQEAMACGCPVVTVKVGGVPEMVSDGETGFLVDPEDDEGFRRSLTRVLSEGALKRRFSRQGRQKAVREFDIRECCRKMADVYRMALESTVKAERHA